MTFPARYFILLTHTNGAWSTTELPLDMSPVEMLDHAEGFQPASGWLNVDGTPNSIRVILIDRDDPCGASDQTLKAVTKWAEESLSNTGHWPTDLAHICPDPDLLDPEAVAGWEADRRYEEAQT